MIVVINASAFGSVVKVRLAVWRNRTHTIITIFNLFKKKAISEVRRCPMTFTRRTNALVVMNQKQTIEAIDVAASS
jgi:hypothetical protein